MKFLAEELVPSRNEIWSPATLVVACSTHGAAKVPATHLPSAKEFKPIRTYTNVAVDSALLSDRPIKYV